MKYDSNMSITYLSLYSHNSHRQWVTDNVLENIDGRELPFHIYAHDWAFNEARKTGRSSLKITSFFSTQSMRCDSCLLVSHIILREKKKFAILRKINLTCTCCDDKNLKLVLFSMSHLGSHTTTEMQYSTSFALLNDGH